MSNVTITTNQTTRTTIVSFTVTGQSGTTGYVNITIPKSTILYGTRPTVYIDGQQAQNQSCTEDANNYYIWYATHFSTHQIIIQFIGETVQATPLLSSWLIPVVVIAIIAAILISIAIALRHKKRS